MSHSVFNYRRASQVLTLTVLASDDFNRADDTTIEGDTTPVGGYTYVDTSNDGTSYGIIGNQAYIPNSGTRHYTWINLGISDVAVEATVATIPNPGGVLTEGMGVCARHNGVSGGGRSCWSLADYRIAGPLFVTRLIRTTAGTETQFGGDFSGAADGDVLRLLCVGSQISAYRNGTLLHSLTDASHQTNTRHGLFAHIPGGTPLNGRMDDIYWYSAT